MLIIQRFGFRIVAGVIVALSLATLAGALDPVPLPDLQLTSIDNQPVKTTALPSKGNWVLVYVQPRSQFSDNLLKLFKREQYPGLEQHAVIIVGGSIDDLKSVKSRYAELDQATWYADTTKNVFTQLKLHGVPVVLGVKQQTIEWSLNGVLSDVSVAKSIVNSWIQQ
jgi:Peroxiredoxin